MVLARHVAALLALNLLLATRAPGQRLVYVPDANAGQGSCNTVPFTGASGWRYQVMVTAGQLGSQPFRITDLAFAPCGTGTFTASPLEVRIAHNPSGRLTTNFTTNLAANLTTLYQGAVTWRYTSGQWSPIGLTRTFDFDGRSSIVVEVRYRAGKGGTTFRRASVLPRAYQYGTGAFSFPWARFLDSGGLKMRFTVKDIYLTGSGAGAPGTAYRFGLLSRADPGRAYQLGTSLGTGPIPLGPRRLHLSADPLLVASTSNTLPSIFSGYAGRLDSGGRAQAALNLPRDNRLKGITLHTAFVVLEPRAPYGIQEISNTVSFTIR